MTSHSSTGPALSLIVPCYNEEAVIPLTIPQLVAAFTDAGWRLQLVAVDNGSSDRTGEIIDGFVADGLPVTPVRIERNQGYGLGILSAIPHCEAPWIGMIPADGQVDPADVVKLFEVVAAGGGRVLGKVRRRFRLDGIKRRLISIAYNGFVFLLWPRLGSIDVNGCPKIMPAAVMRSMDLQSKEWFLDPEIMVKAHHLGVRVLEMNVFGQMRSAGVSHVRMATCWEFFSKLLKARFGGWLRAWRKQAVAAGARDVPGPAPMPPPARPVAKGRT